MHATAPIMSVDTPALTPAERVVLLTAINATLFGIFRFEVAFTYSKQTTAKPRLAGVDYLPLPGVTGKLHHGILCGVLVNAEGKLRLRIADRSRGDGARLSVPTDALLSGLTAFQVRAVLPPNG